jgi:hypothetical protein
MARGHYGFQRRQKEQLRKAKQDAKRQRQADRAQGGESGPEMGEAPTPGVEPGVWEWFSPSRTRVMAMKEGTRPDVGEPDDWVLLTEVAEDDAPDDDKG